MATAERPAAGIDRMGSVLVRGITLLGDLSVFLGQTLRWAFARRLPPGTLAAMAYTVGVRSVPVIAVTGMFIGMVLAVQAYSQFNQFGLANHLGGMINVSVVRELGPVLAATMLAGRVGSAMAAELATMRVTEQIDALSCLGVNPIHYLVVPRFLACVLLIPLLTVIADFMGVMGGALICIHVYGIDAHFYWMHAQNYLSLYDIISGVIKPTVFGAAIAIIACHRGFNSRPGAEGVGRSSTEAFVVSFMAILVLDFFLALFLNGLHDLLWPAGGSGFPW